MANVRKECIKSDLPRNMQGLCGEVTEFSPTYLFGEDLNNKIKQVSELNKVKNKFNFPYKGGNKSFKGGFHGNRYQKA